MTNSEKPTNPKDAVGIRKIPTTTMSQLVSLEVGAAMLEGAAKYGRHNYREAGVRASVYYDGTRRHLDFWWEGQDIDPASGLNHITKAIASLYVLRDAMINGMWEDDRPPCHIDLDAFQADLEAKVCAILDTPRKDAPVHYTRMNCVPLSERVNFEAHLVSVASDLASEATAEVGAEGADASSYAGAYAQSLLEKPAFVAETKRKFLEALHRRTK